MAGATCCRELVEHAVKAPQRIGSSSNQRRFWTSGKSRFLLAENRRYAVFCTQCRQSRCLCKPHGFRSRICCPTVCALPLLLITCILPYCFFAQHRRRLGHPRRPGVFRGRLSPRMAPSCSRSGMIRRGSGIPCRSTLICNSLAGAHRMPLNIFGWKG